MFNTIKYTLLELIRMPGILIWSLAFPLVLMSVFAMMFGPLDDMEDIDPIALVVVEPDESPDGIAFSTFIDAISGNSSNGDSSSNENSQDSRLLDVTFVSSAEDAESKVKDSMSEEKPFAGYVQLVDGVPDLYLTDADSVSGMQDIEASVLVMVMDEYTAKAHMLKEMMQTNPEAIRNPAVISSVLGGVNATEQVEVTHNQPKESVRYYFALLGMAALFGASVSLVAFQRMKPNLSALGARRMVGALGHGRAVLATLLACWIVNCVCLAIAYVFMRFVIGIDFGNRDAGCLLAIAASSLMAVSLGCAVSAIPNVPENGKSGIVTGIVCFLSLFAGLYGQPTMELADSIDSNFPLLSWINPATQIAQSFYSVMYYDSMTPLFTHVLVLLVISAVLFALAVGSLRRQRYASI